MLIIIIIYMQIKVGDRMMNSVYFTLRKFCSLEMQHNIGT